MTKFFLLSILSFQLFSADIEALKKDKIYHKQQNKQKNNKNYEENKVDKSRFIIVFNNKKDTDMKILKNKYHLVLEKCLVTTVCIFKKDETIPYNIGSIKQEIKNIEEIKYYKYHQFKMY